MITRLAQAGISWPKSTVSRPIPRALRRGAFQPQKTTLEWSRAGTGISPFWPYPGVSLQACITCVGTGIMNSIEQYRTNAENCLRRASDDTNEHGNALWVTLA